MKNNCRKKVLSIVLAVAMMAGIVTPGEVAKAASDRTVQVVTSKDNVKRGDEFTATVKLAGDFTGDYTMKDGYMVSGGSVALVYDPNQLELIKENSKDQIGDVLQSTINGGCTLTKKTGNILLSFYGEPYEEIGAEELFTVTFKVKDNAAGNIGLSLDKVKFNHTYTYENEDGEERDEFIPIDVTPKNKEVALDIPLESISLNKDKLTLNKGASEKLTVNYTPADTTEKNVTWSTENDKVATVAADGTVTAVGKGKTTITATVGTKKATCAVTVNNPATGITLNKTTMNLKKGDSDTLIATATPEGADMGTVTWTSDKPEIAEVNSNGLVTAKKDGVAVITATAGTLTATCTVEVREIKLNSISLDQTTMQVARGKNKQLTVIYNPENTTDDKRVEWSSSNTDIVTVDGDGNVTGEGKGSAVVTAKVGTHIATCTVDVNVPLESISFSTDKLEIIKKQTSEALKEITYNPADTDDDKTVTWASSDPSVATVDDTGKITAVKAGVTTITATSSVDSNIKAACEVTVKELPITGVYIDKESASVEKGETVQLNAHVLPENTTDEDKNITWTSDHPEIATVSSTGLVTGVKGGNAVITATASNGEKAECKIFVLSHMEGLEIQEPSSTEVLKGKTLSLSAKALPEDATDKYDIAWTSEKPEVATVDETGMVTGVSEGTTTITAKSTVKGASFEDSIEITVKEIHMTGFELSYNEENLTDGKLLKGQSLRIAPEFTPADTTDDRTITWTVSDEEIASIDQNGVVTGLKEGKVKVKATPSVAELAKEVELEIKEIPLKSIAFDKVISTMTEGEKAVLNVIYNPENTTDIRDVVWSTSDEKVLTVENGTLTAVKAGKAVITAKVGKQTISCEITVKAKEVSEDKDNKPDPDKEKDNDKNNIKTGDTADVVVPIVLAAISLFVIAMMLLRRKVRR